MSLVTVYLKWAHFRTLKLFYHCRSIKHLAIERLLWIAEAYILSVEEIHSVPRVILPHGASFHGYQLNFLVKCEALKQEFTLQVVNKRKKKKTFLSSLFAYEKLLSKSSEIVKTLKL